AHVTARHPGVAGLERNPGISREVQHALSAAADALVVHQASDSVVRAREEAGRQTGQIEEAAQREQILRRGRIVRRGRARADRKDERVTLERARHQPRGGEAVEILLRADALPLTPPFELERLAVPREENAVELVVGESGEEPAALELVGGQARLADQYARAARAATHADAHLAPVGNLPPKVDSALHFAHAVFGDPVALAQLEKAALLEFRLRNDEVAACDRLRLVVV